MFTDSTDEFEGSAQETALQKLWSRRLTLTGGLLEEPETTLLEDLFPAAAQDDDTGPEKGHHSGSVHDSEEFEVPGEIWDETADVESKERYVHLNAALLGDIPASYVIKAPADHEYPVVGAYLDTRVVTGFKYRVRPLHELVNSDWLFSGRALTLLHIGRGYSRRLTFEAGDNSLNHNDNYFWSDSRPEGFAFELEVLSPGAKFTVHDANGEACATMEVVRLRGPQLEVAQEVLPGGRVVKTVKIETLAKLEWYEEGQAAAVLPVSGLAECLREAGCAARITRVTEVSVGSHARRGFTLTPGGQDKWRRTTVQGIARYTIVGLEAHEVPVIGTYVDPRLIPGFEYRVRPAGSPHALFNNAVLRLVSIGRGYAKRLDFAADVGRLNAADNYLWSDTHPEGLGLEVRAVHAGMMFTVEAAGQTLGVAAVFRADAAQQEVDQEVISTPAGSDVIKRIHVDVTCHVTLSSTNEKRGGEAQTLRVSGCAVVRRAAGERCAMLVRVENIGFDSQLFVSQQIEFHPVEEKRYRRFLNHV